MDNKPLSYRAAAKYATGMFILIALLVWLLFHFGRGVFLPADNTPPPDRDFNPWFPVISLVWTYFYLFVLFALNFKVLESPLKDWRRNAVALAGSLTLAIVSFASSLFIFCLLAGAERFELQPLRLGPLLRDAVFALIVFFWSQLIYLNAKKQQMLLEYEAMKAENARSRFEALKNQLDPHFLFNTFNTLDSLIEEEPARARNYLQKLSSVFRYVMPNKEVITLEEELAFTCNYIELMQLRYEDSLIFDFRIDERYLPYEIVPLSIQVLIENAIKHNVIVSEHPLVIHVTVGPEPFVTVSNEIRPKKIPAAGSGIGLSNLAERFRLKLQKEIDISDAKGYFTVCLPLHTHT